MSENSSGMGDLFACPLCGTKMVDFGPDRFRCPTDDRIYEQKDGIWRFLRPGREAFFAQFIEEYETIRRAEGRAGGEEFYRALPYADLSGVRRADWRIRAASMRAMITWVLEPLEKELNRPLYILDLGAGNGWLSNCLSARGHVLAAVDLLDNDWDGLGAYVHYETRFERFQAEFEALPFLDNRVDLAIFNASLHYALSYERTLGEAWRVLRSGGLLVILDSPIYPDASSGKAMVLERETDFQRRYGFPSNVLPAENFLTEARLNELAHNLSLHWNRLQPLYNLAWKWRFLKARLRGRRTPARFEVIWAEKSAN